MNDYSLMRFLEELAECSGDEAMELISKFQSGLITVEGISSEEAIWGLNYEVN